MADVDRDEKTEEATPRKQEQLREKGQVAKSADVSGVAALIGALATLGVLGRSISIDVAHYAERSLRLQDAHRPLEALTGFGAICARSVLPVAGVAALFAVGVTLAQTRLLFSMETATPKLERLDPVQGMKRLLPSEQMASELLKSVLKIAIIGGLVWRAVESSLPRFSVLPGAQLEQAAGSVASVIGRLLVEGVIGLSLVAALDYGLAWRKHRADARMAPHEVKREHRESEGDPVAKSRRRQRARELAKHRATADVQHATVLVTNPTHVSIALRYDPARDAAPMLVAKGLDEVAMRMRTEARRHGIPIVENKPLARAVHASTKVGDAIPVELYEAAARIIAHVLSLKGASA